VHVAGLRGIKLLLVLTNGGSAAWGGMKQYTDWVDPALTVTDFYGNDTVKVTVSRRRQLRKPAGGGGLACSGNLASHSSHSSCQLLH
jgi:hypothetical protein